MHLFGCPLTSSSPSPREREREIRVRVGSENDFFGRGLFEREEGERKAIRSMPSPHYDEGGELHFLCVCVCEFPPFISLQGDSFLSLFLPRWGMDAFSYTILLLLLSLALGCEGDALKVVNVMLLAILGVLIKAQFICVTSTQNSTICTSVKLKKKLKQLVKNSKSLVPFLPSHCGEEKK